jgi:hypothetical protein
VCADATFNGGLDCFIHADVQLGRDLVVGHFVGLCETVNLILWDLKRKVALAADEEDGNLLLELFDVLEVDVQFGETVVVAQVEAKQKSVAA